VTSATDLKQTFEGLLKQELAGTSTAHLLDYPFNLNPGDAAIWLGEKKALQNLSIASRSFMSTYKEQQAQSVDTVLLHGGGNFGDIWPEHTAYREQVLVAAYGRPVLQLPVSFHADDLRSLRGLQKRVANHGRVTFMWRDSRSFAAGSDTFPGARHILSPDAAFTLTAPTTPTPIPTPRTSVLLVHRRDKETALAEPSSQAMSVDWDFTRAFKATSGWYALRAATLAGTSAVVPERALDRLSRAQLRYAFQLLSSAGIIVTDRLHGHILATMLGIPNILYPERYGKNRAFFETWTRGISDVYWENSLDEAVARAVSLAEVH